MRTTALYTEINHVINTFGGPFFQLLAVRAVPANIVSFPPFNHLSSLDPTLMAARMNDIDYRQQNHRACAR